MDSTVPEKPQRFDKVVGLDPKWAQSIDKKRNETSVDKAFIYIDNDI